MTKRLLAGATACTLAAMPAIAEELQVFTWADYFAEDTVSNFEAETGIDVVLTYYDSSETMETRILTGGSGFDVVLSASSSVSRFVTSGLLTELGTLPLQNIGNLDPVILEKLTLTDGGGFYSVPYMWGANGIGYDKAKVEALVPGIDMSDLKNFYDPEVMAKLSECGFAIIDSPSEIIGVTLNYLGHSPQSSERAEIDAAMELLEGIRPHIRYINSVKIIDDLASGEICAAFTYSGDAATAGVAAAAAGNGIDIQFVIPQQGTVLWVDVWNVLAEGPNPSASAKFLDYIMRPEVIADISNTVNYANANLLSKPFVLEEIRNDPGLYPPTEVQARLYPSVALGDDAQRLQTRAWTRFKTGQ